MRSRRSDRPWISPTTYRRPPSGKGECEFMTSSQVAALDAAWTFLRESVSLRARCRSEHDDSQNRLQGSRRKAHGRNRRGRAVVCCIHAAALRGARANTARKPEISHLLAAAAEDRSTRTQIDQRPGPVLSPLSVRGARFDAPPVAQRRRYLRGVEPGDAGRSAASGAPRGRRNPPRFGGRAWADAAAFALEGGRAGPTGRRAVRR